MTEEEFKSLDVGDIVRHCNSPNGMVVIATTPLTLTRVVFPSNPQEWDLIFKSKLEAVDYKNL